MTALLALVLAAVASHPRSEMAWNPILLAREGRSQGLQFKEGALSLASQSGQGPLSGSFISPPLATGFDATYYGVLMDLVNPPGGTFSLSVRVESSGGIWGPWKAVDHFENLADSPETPVEKRRYLSAGPLIESTGIRALQWRATLSSPASGISPRLRELRFLYADLRR